MSRDPKQWLALLLTVSVLMFSHPVLAQNATNDTPLVTNAFVRLPRSSNSHSTAVYMTVTNMTRTPDRLIGASSALAERVELHAIMLTNSLRRMHEIEDIVLPTDRPMELAPGGFHLMLIGLKKSLDVGTEVPLELRFANAGTVNVMAKTVEFKSTHPAQ